MMGLKESLVLMLNEVREDFMDIKMIGNSNLCRAGSALLLLVIEASEFDLSPQKNHSQTLVEGGGYLYLPFNG